MVEGTFCAQFSVPLSACGGCEEPLLLQIWSLAKCCEFVFSWWDWYKVSDGVVENKHGWGQLSVSVRGISVLKHRTLKMISV